MNFKSASKYRTNVTDHLTNNLRIRSEIEIDNSCNQYNDHGLVKSLKIPKWSSESINRRTDNTMDRRKRTKGQTTIYKTLHKNKRSNITNPTKNAGAPEG